MRPGLPVENGRVPAGHVQLPRAKLEGHEAMQSRVFGLVDHAHPEYSRD
jgi:hypothetical protein